MLEHGALPTTDPFSYTMGGRSWTLNSWGFDLLLGLVARLGGLVAVAVLSGLAVAAVGSLVLAGGPPGGGGPRHAGGGGALPPPPRPSWVPGPPPPPRRL